MPDRKGLWSKINNQSTITIALVLSYSLPLVIMDVNMETRAGTLGFFSFGFAIILAVYSVIEFKLKERYEAIFNTYKMTNDYVRNEFIKVNDTTNNSGYTTIHNKTDVGQ